MNVCSTTPALIVLEVLLNVTMIVEIGVRAAALRSRFLDSWGNVADVLVVMLCLLTLLIVRDRCTGALDVELGLDALVLAGRNALQAIRLWTIVNR